MKSVLRIYINHRTDAELCGLIEEASCVDASQHETIAGRVRRRLREHLVLKRFDERELKMGSFVHRYPIWIENSEEDFDVLGGNGICLDLRLTFESDIIAFFAVRHYFNVPAGKVVKLGRASGIVDEILGGSASADRTYDGRVAWVISYDPTRDNTFRYRLDIECKNLRDLSAVAMKIVACEQVA